MHASEVAGESWFFDEKDSEGEVETKESGVRDVWGKRKGALRIDNASVRLKATSGRFLSTHPLCGGHVAVAALYSHGWHVAVRRYPKSPFMSKNPTTSYCWGAGALEGWSRYLIF